MSSFFPTQLQSLPKVLTYLPLTLTLSLQAGRGEKDKSFAII